MFVKIWGSRGSLATPGAAYMRFGGNTPCLEVRSENNDLLILDAGSGIRNLAKQLLSQMPLDFNMIISHTHYDHIIGLPFFTPLFISGNNINIYGPTNQKGLSLHQAMIEFFSDTFFPANLEDFKAKVTFKNLDEEVSQIGAFKVTTCYSNHPITTLACRIECDGKSLVYTSDTEQYINFLENNLLASEFEKHNLDDFIQSMKNKWAGFLEGADLCIYDAHYTPSEYPKFRGWGHSDMQTAIHTCEENNVKRVLLFHHSPDRDDNEIEDLQAYWKKYAGDHSLKVNVSFAVEGRRYHV